MSGIWNVNNIYNASLKKLTNKLSFQVGEVFLARVMNLDENNDEVLLRLLDGWQFPAKLKKPLDFQPLGLIKFKVEGFKDGKLELLIADNKNPQERLNENSIENVLRRENILVDKKDYSILEKMIKHNMPLTKDNISYIKNLMEVHKNISQDIEQQKNFINKYIESKNININCEEGKIIKNTLKDFFKELGNLSEDDILTMLESGIDLTEDNIRSFNKIFKSSSSVYKMLKNLDKNIKDNILTKNNSNINQQSVDKNSENKKEQLEINKKDMSNSTEKNNDNLQKTLVDFEDMDNKNFKTNSKEELKSIEKNNSNEKHMDSLGEKDDNVQFKNNDDSINKKNINFKRGIFELSNDIKEQINDKLENMKNILKDIIEVNRDMKPENLDKFINMIKQDMNDFKVFNTLSDQYYYIDLPININKDEYECKLVIKDERKKGKKIDSKNVKIATSVKTVNMGVIDAFLAISNNIMNVDIKANKQWINILDSKKQRVLNALQDTGYNVYISIGEKIEEFNITTCSKFFEDSNMNAIDMKA